MGRAHSRFRKEPSPLREGHGDRAADDRVFAGGFAVGLLAWILEKFFEWSDTVDSPFETISRDRFLDNETLYWLTAIGASAARIYFESHQSLDPDLRVTVPAALTTYPYDIEKHPRPWAEQRFRNIVRWQAPEAGGHFPALEMSGEFVRDLREGMAAVLAASV